MINQELIKYIQEQLQSGVDKEEIKRVLIAQGWQEVDINEGFSHQEGGTSEAVGQVKTVNQEKPETADIVEDSVVDNIVTVDNTESTKKPVNIKLITIIALVVILISAAGVGAWYTVNKDKVDNTDDMVLEENQNIEEELAGTTISETINFENDILESVTEHYKEVESFSFNGVVKFKNRMEDAENIFTGKIILPNFIQISQNIKNDSSYNNPDGDEPLIKETNRNTVAVKDNIYTQHTKDGMWQSGFNDEVFREKPWITLYYAQELEYINKDEGKYHYYVRTKDYEFGSAARVITSLGINFGVSTTAGGLAGTEIEGEVWVDDNYYIVKEKFRIPTSEGGADIWIEYADFNKEFLISTPDEINSSEYQEKNQKIIDDRINFMDIANFRLTIDMYYDSYGYYPDKLDDVAEYLSGGENSDQLQRAETNNYLYARSTNEKEFHLGVTIETDDDSRLETDDDFNSLEAGFENGFDGADPVYDIHGGM